jgi:hypothetical protein
MTNQIVFPGKVGPERPALTRLTQTSTLEVLRLRAIYADGSPVDLTGITLSGIFARQNETAVYPISGSLTVVTGQEAEGWFDWQINALDVALAGKMQYLFAYTDGSDSWWSRPVDVEIQAVPGVNATPPNALVRRGLDGAYRDADAGAVEYGRF